MTLSCGSWTASSTVSESENVYETSESGSWNGDFRNDIYGCKELEAGGSNQLKMGEKRQKNQQQIKTTAVTAMTYFRIRMSRTAFFCALTPAEDYEISRQGTGTTGGLGGRGWFGEGVDKYFSKKRSGKCPFYIPRWGTAGLLQKGASLRLAAETTKGLSRNPRPS